MDYQIDWALKKDSARRIIRVRKVTTEDEG